jgi:hypothetical protein
MMHTCPHCKRQGVNSWAKLTSGNTRPAICSFCGRSCVVDRNFKLAIVGLHNLVLAALGIYAMYQRRWWPVAVYAAFLVLVNVSIVRFGPLMECDESLIGEARAKRNLVLCIVALLLAGDGWLFRQEILAWLSSFLHSAP